MEDSLDIGQARRWRLRNIRALQSAFRDFDRGNLRHNPDGPARVAPSAKTDRLSGDEKSIASNRLTLLDDPGDLGPATNSRYAGPDEVVGPVRVATRTIMPAHRETVLPANSAQPVGPSQDAKVNSSEMRHEQLGAFRSETDSLSRVKAGDRMRVQSVQDSQSSWSSSTALLILLVCYIVWQCFRGQQDKQRKCLDDWSSLLTPSRGKPARRKRSSTNEECELRTMRQQTATATQDQKTGGTSATLRLSEHDNPNEPEIEIIRGHSNKNCDDVDAVKKTGMRRSLVVAANRAKPTVRLIGEKMRGLVDVEAHPARDGPAGRTFAHRLKQLLQAGGWLRRDSSRCEETNGESVSVPANNTVVDEQTETHPSEVAPANSDTIEVVVHRTIVEQSESSESLVGFAGSFLEPSVNLVNEYSGLDAPQHSLHDRPLSSHVATCSSGSNLQLSPAQTKSPLDLLGPAPTCDCVHLARSKSQSGQPYCHMQAASQYLSTSPANVRPCCSVSPSAMSRHDNAVAHQQLAPHCIHHPLPNHHELPSGLCRTPMGQSSPPCAMYCSNNRAKHHYENYYDDEQEDAYRRLTATIGVQFGLAVDHHAQNSLLPAARPSASCTVACKCNSSPPRQNILVDNASMMPGGPVNAGDISLGDSDSGNFSLVNKQRVNSDSICNDSNCSLCQSSLLTDPPRHPLNMFANGPPSLDPSGTLQGSPPVPRWHSRRRSTLYARPPRRMSIAGVACQQSAVNGYGITHPQHFLHRASIASDGANSFHQHHHQSNTAARQLIFPTAHFCAGKKSSYSSSAGSSSGIGFSGSQCLNTATPSSYPNQSFAFSKPCYDGQLSEAQHAAQNEMQPVAWHAVPGVPQAIHDMQCAHMNVPTCSSNRKLSLPVQLESNAAGHLIPSGGGKPNLLFYPQKGNVSPRCLASSSRTAKGSSHSPNTFVDEALTRTGLTLSQKSSEQIRRSSQTITRQSSFWLEDGFETGQEPTPDMAALDDLARPVESAGENVTHVIEKRGGDSAPASSSTPPESPCGAGQSSGLGGTASSKTKHSQHKIQHSSSSSTSSPSPDFHRLHRQRLSNRTAQTTSITKKRFLGSLKHRRGHKKNGTGVRRVGSQGTNQAAPQKQDTNSTDDEHDKTKHDDSLSSFDREVANAVAKRTIPDINSTSLERQCRDLWKLRATLHDDALVGDNWSNYHQRLNRRYDSGYKSIENQFSSSIEGSVPIALGLGLQQTPMTTGNENNLPEPGRPQSGCSGMIQEQGDESSKDLVSTILNEEETQALLENCDDQQDE